jgi:hypothetical protein
VKVSRYLVVPYLLICVAPTIVAAELGTVPYHMLALNKIIIKLTMGGCMAGVNINALE